MMEFYFTDPDPATEVVDGQDDVVGGQADVVGGSGGGGANANVYNEAAALMEEDQEFDGEERLLFFQKQKQNKAICCAKNCYTRINFTQLKIHLHSMCYIQTLPNPAEIKRMIMLACYCTSMSFKQPHVRNKTKQRRVANFRVPSFDIAFCKTVFLQLFDICSRTFIRWKKSTNDVRTIVPSKHGLVGREGWVFLVEVL